MIRFSMRLLLVTMMLLGLGIAAAQWNHPVFASVAFTGMVAMWGLSLVGSLCQRGEERAYWIGFAVFLWVYSENAYSWSEAPQMTRVWSSFNISSVRMLNSAGGNPRPPLLTDYLLDNFVQPRPNIGDTVSAQWSSGSYYDAIIREKKDGLYLADWIDGSSDSWVRLNQINILTGSGRQTSHAIFALLVAVWGGTIARTIFSRVPVLTAQPSRPEHAPPAAPPASSTPL